MKSLTKNAFLGPFAGTLLIATAGAVQSAEIDRVYGPNAISPIAAGVSVPPGYTMFYISGALPSPVSPAAPGTSANYGDIAQQTRSVLDNLKATMDKMGVGFGDVVAAHVIQSRDLRECRAARRSAASCGSASGRCRR